MELRFKGKTGAYDKKYVLSFSTAAEFVAAESQRVLMHKHANGDIYLEQIWNDAQKENDFAVKHPEIDTAINTNNGDAEPMVELNDSAKSGKSKVIKERKPRK